MSLYDVINDYGNVLQQDYLNYLENGVPVEDEILDIAQGTEKEQAAVRAMELSDQAFDNSALQTNQQLARFGIRLNDAQRGAKAREYGMARILSRVNAANNTRYSESERQDQARDIAMNLGGNLYQSSLNKLGYAAQGASQQLQYDAMKKLAKRSRRFGMASTALGAGAAFMLSDENKKKNIRDNDNATSLRDVLSMKTKRFEYKEDAGQPEGEYVGVLHQEAPESIKAESGGEKGVNIANWVGELTGAVQELSGRIDNMERLGFKGIKGGAA